jgi:hypothetical protein
LQAVFFLCSTFTSHWTSIWFFWWEISMTLTADSCGQHEHIHMQR